MKKIYYCLLAMPLLFAAASCTEPQDPEPAPATPLELSTYELSFGYDELRLDKPVDVIGGGETFEVEVTYADAENDNWVDYAIDGRTINVALTRENVDPAEEAREATLTVTSGEETKEVKITQVSYVETDPAMTMPAEGLEFPFSGSESTLTKSITATSKVDLTEAETVDAEGVDATVEWITSVSVEGRDVTVKVVTNDAYEPREALVKVTNRLGGTATFAVKQVAKPELNLVGTWNWSSLNAVEDTKAGWEAATTITGTCTITATDGGYVVTGIKGNGKGLADLIAANPGAEINPMIYIAQNGRELSIGMGREDLMVAPVSKFDVAFTVSDKKYYAGKTLYYGHQDEVTGELNPDGGLFSRMSGYQKLDFPAIHSVAGATETVAFTTTYVDESVKIDLPGNDDPVAPVVAVGYSYFDAIITRQGRFSSLSEAKPLDIHRNIVLTRGIE